MVSEAILVLRIKRPTHNPRVQSGHSAAKWIVEKSLCAWKPWAFHVAIDHRASLITWGQCSAQHGPRSR